MAQIHTHEAGANDSAYDGLVVDDARWAFGAGEEFEQGGEPLAGVDTAVPDGADPADLAAYCLMLGDDALVMSHRLSEWCSRAPDLEEDIALANIALDLLGQARLLLARAAAADPRIVPDGPLPGCSTSAEDALAFFRKEQQLRNVRLVELPRGDFGETMARLLVFSAYRLALFERLAASRDRVLAAIAAKGVKELTYHRDFAARWFVTLAQGTAESRHRLLDGLQGLLPFLPELFATHEVEAAVTAADVGVDPSTLAPAVEAVLREACSAADVPAPTITPESTGPRAAGRAGRHTDALGPMLAEMQVVARAHPRGKW